MWSLVVLRGIHVPSQIGLAPIGCGDGKALEEPWEIRTTSAPVTQLTTLS